MGPTETVIQRISWYGLRESSATIGGGQHAVGPTENVSGAPCGATERVMGAPEVVAGGVWSGPLGQYVELSMGARGV